MYASIPPYRREVRAGPMSLPVGPEERSSSFRTFLAGGESMPGFIKTEMEDRLAIITVSRPDALNALNSTVLRELSMAIEHLSMAADVESSRKTVEFSAFRADRKSTRLNSSHLVISYAVFCLKKKNDSI